MIKMNCCQASDLWLSVIMWFIKCTYLKPFWLFWLFAITGLIIVIILIIVISLIILIKWLLPFQESPNLVCFHSMLKEKCFRTATRPGTACCHSRRTVVLLFTLHKHRARQQFLKKNAIKSKYSQLITNNDMLGWLQNSASQDLHFASSFLHLSMLLDVWNSSEIVT